MARIINASIDLTKIDKSKIINHKNGSKYLSIDITINDEKDRFDQDVSISVSQTKDERANKDKKVYLGNGKTVWSNENQQKQQSTEQQQTKNQYKGDKDISFNLDDDDELPF